MKASDYIAKFLKAQGVSHVFELSGGMITHILDSLYETEDMQIVSMHHEQGAAFAADGFARVKGVPGIALATSGPGATNLLTGIGSCYYDSVPAVFITGQVNQHEQKGQRPIRQLGFQETDIAEMSGPITKAVFKVQDASQLPEILKKAFTIALSDRPGPVLIDIPMNLQRVDIEVGEIVKVQMESSHWLKSDEVLDGLFEDLKGARKPLILAGRGIMSSFSRTLLLNFAELTGIPVVTSLLSLDAIPFNHRLRVGFIGAYGNRWANLAIGECDFMIVIGSRLDIRQTGADVKGFIGNKTIYHVEIDPNEINNRLQNCIPVQTDIRTFFNTALLNWRKKSFPAFNNWYKIITDLKTKWPDIKECVDLHGINPNLFLHHLSQRSKGAEAYVADVGSNQMWAAQSLELSEGQFFLTSGGMGAMGYALPAAIGASFAVGKKAVVVIAGDGGFQINLQEMQTIIRNKLPLKIVVLNNESLGMIRQFQDSYFDSKYQSTVWGYSTPDFQKIAQAYGMDTCTIRSDAEVRNGIEALWKDPFAPYLLQVMIDQRTNAYPKIAFGKPITEMEPHSKPIEMEGT